MRKNTETVTYQKETEKAIIDRNTGEVLSEEKSSSKTIRLETEPPYVKLYLDCLSQFKGMQLSLNPILLDFVKRANYADPDEEEGGQLIYVNKAMKEAVAKKCNVSLKRVEQALTEFVRKKIFKRIAIGTYQVNPNLFGRGEWKAVKAIRATFDFNTGEAYADIVKDEEAELTMATNVIEEESNARFAELNRMWEEELRRTRQNETQAQANTN